MFGEVLEVLGVEGRERQAVGQGARRDPGVVGWPGPSLLDRGREYRICWGAPGRRLLAIEDDHCELPLRSARSPPAFGLARRKWMPRYHRGGDVQSRRRGGLARLLRSCNPAYRASPGAAANGVVMRVPRAAVSWVASGVLATSGLLTLTACSSPPSCTGSCLGPDMVGVVFRTGVSPSTAKSLVRVCQPAAAIFRFDAIQGDRQPEVIAVVNPQAQRRSAKGSAFLRCLRAASGVLNVGWASSMNITTFP
jgi:hypothetical protein